jgi:hypothetical protein
VFRVATQHGVEAGPAAAPHLLEEGDHVLIQADACGLLSDGIDELGLRPIRIHEFREAGVRGERRPRPAGGSPGLNRAAIRCNMPQAKKRECEPREPVAD